MKIYTKRELAMLYFPNCSPKAATNNLARWINRTFELRQLLTDAGYKPANRYFTVRQIELIYRFFGEP